MSYLELQSQVEKLPVQERVALMQYIQHSLTPAQIEAFWVEEAERITDLIDAGHMRTYDHTEFMKQCAQRTAL